MSGKVTTMGSKIHKDSVPSYDAGVIDRLTEAGAIFLGKLNMHEYALGGKTDNPHFGTCRNPWDLSKTPGGSSEGSAVAVASMMAVATLGSDTSGSIRIPAAICGVLGLKPTYGRVSKYGCLPEAWTLDRVGPIARKVAAAAIMLNTISGYDYRDPTSLSLPPTHTYESLSKAISNLVVGVEQYFFFADPDDVVGEIVLAGIDQLRRLGATIKPIKVPTLRNCVYTLTIIDTSETTTVHNSMLRSRPLEYGEDVRFLLECGALPSAVDYLQAQQIRRRIKLEFDEVFSEVDAIVAPTLPIRTPNIGELTPPSTARATTVSKVSYGLWARLTSLD
jgi:aspartyl-tRNA(Asn)/glutamyl-tRNA(Gln) amidotransferase subunit A